VGQARCRDDALEKKRSSVSVYFAVLPETTMRSGNSFRIVSRTVALIVTLALLAGAGGGCMTHPGASSGTSPKIGVDILGVPRSTDTGTTSNRVPVYRR
jgi:hypothetical protein